MITRKPSPAIRSRVAELDPVHLRVGEQAVEEDYRPSLPELVIGERHIVGRGPVMDRRFAHPGKLPVASVHLSTSFG